MGTASGPGGANADWIHINAIHYHEEWDQIVFSSRYQSEIFVIDHSTTTEEEQVTVVVIMEKAVIFSIDGGILKIMIEEIIMIIF